MRKQRKNRPVYRTFANRGLEILEGRAFLSTYTVTTTADSGAGSLRQAITDANAHAGTDVVAFAIGSGAKTISPAKGLPGLGDHTILDATTQPGYAGSPLITLNGAGAGSADGIRISGTGATVRGLAITHFGGSGMLVMGKGSNTIAGNVITSNGAHGILLQSPNNTVGGSTSADRNVIGGNGQSGVFVYTAAARNNTIAGNFIGSDTTGSNKLGNLNGIQIDGASGNQVRGNLISGNSRDGVLIVNSGATLNVLQYNYIGLNAAGTARLGNGWYGIEISRPDNVVGGRNAGNVISANGKGGVVLFLSTSSGNRVQGNYIGTDKTGKKDLGNIGRGVEFTNSAHDNRVGGGRRGEGNLISGNDLGGVGIYSSSRYNLVQGNLIGTAAGGVAALGNTGAGIIVTDGAGTNIIGGAGLGNVVSGNTQGVVLTAGTQPSIVQGNLIGTDVTASGKIANAGDGIFVGSSQNQIGGKKKGTGNIISGNGGDGIRFSNSSGNLVRRNVVGASAAGGSLPNGGNGVLMNGTSNTSVGGNTIAFNRGCGVKVNSGSNNPIVSNSIHDNAELPIDQNSSSQIAPVLGKSTATRVKGSVSGKANTSIYVELFAGSGRTFVGSATVKTDAKGKASFAIEVENCAGQTIVATATTTTTSEFSTAMTLN